MAAWNDRFSFVGSFLCCAQLRDLGGKPPRTHGVQTRGKSVDLDLYLDALSPVRRRGERPLHLEAPTGIEGFADLDKQLLARLLALAHLAGNARLTAVIDQPRQVPARRHGVDGAQSGIVIEVILPAVAKHQALIGRADILAIARLNVALVKPGRLAFEVGQKMRPARPRRPLVEIRVLPAAHTHHLAAKLGEARLAGGKSFEHARSRLSLQRRGAEDEQQDDGNQKLHGAPHCRSPCASSGSSPGGEPSKSSLTTYSKSASMGRSNAAQSEA